MGAGAPIPDEAFLQVTDQGGASFGGGPHTITSALTWSAPAMGQLIDLGAYLTEKLRKQAVGSDAIEFSLTLQPQTNVVATTWDWNSVDVAELWWWFNAKKNQSALTFVYRPDASAAASATNLEVTVHVGCIPNSPNVPGQPDTPEEFEITINADYLKVDNGSSPLEWGTALV
jgi:hypothetical protein